MERTRLSAGGTLRPPPPAAGVAAAPAPPLPETPYPIRVALWVLTGFLFLDLVANTAAVAVLRQPSLLLAVTGVQLGAIVIGFIAMMLVMMETQLFKAGYSGTLYRRFTRVILVVVLYLGTSIALFTLYLTRAESSEFYWDDGLLAAFVIHKLLSALYFFFLKRAVLKLSQPQLYSRTATTIG